MSKANNNKHTSADDKPRHSAKELTPLPAETKAERAGASPSDHADAARSPSEIPKFDLAQQIMAEQRKIAAVRRKGPGKQSASPARELEPEPTRHALEPPIQLSEQERVIADIVARDIEELYRRSSC